jgi:hypothetical protein
MPAKTRKPLDDTALAGVTGGTGPLDPLPYTGQDTPPVTPIDPETEPGLLEIGDEAGTATTDGSGMVPWG